ncbi:uncharacterized protein LOC135123169 isoform X3 [Zophobas morio]
MHLFKVWDQTRTKKGLILIKEPGNVYVDLILKASQKLEINGATVVLESDGTPVEEEEILIAVKHETLILLEPGQVWLSSQSQCEISESSSGPNNHSFMSLTSTETIASTKSNECISGATEFLNNDSSSLDSTIQASNCNLEFSWTNFVIPWEKIPQDMLQCCAQGKRDKYAITEIVHIVVNEMKQISESIPSKAFKIVSFKMVDKYPATFRDYDDDGVVLGDGTASLKTKLQERYHYLKRPHKRPVSTSPETPLHLAKIKKNATAGCAQWAPPYQKAGAAAKNKLNTFLDDASDEFFHLLEETFAEQRAFINSVDPPSITNIKDQWPVLFKVEAIKWHFNKVTNGNISNLTTNLQLKAEKIVNFGLQHKIIISKDVRRDSAEIIALEVFARYFQENIYGAFYLKFQDETMIEITQNEPCIINCTVENQFYIYMEKERVVQCKSFFQALECCFSLYFIFNLHYPKETSTFLEMIQRYFLKIHPDSGSKSRKLSASKKNVLGLMRKLRDIYTVRYKLLIG